MKYIEEEEDILDISPLSNVDEEPDVIEEIEDVVRSGPKSDLKLKQINIIESRSELESEPIITEGIDANEKDFNKVTEVNKEKIHHITPDNISKIQKEQPLGLGGSFADFEDTHKSSKDEDILPVGGTDDSEENSNDSYSEKLFINSKELPLMIITGDYNRMKNLTQNILNKHKFQYHTHPHNFGEIIVISDLENIV